MSHKFHDSKKNSKFISCPECHSRMNTELVEYLFEGHTVFCEMCGFAFTGISEEGEVKPLEKLEGQEIVSPELSKKEIQWIEWKKEWNGIKDTIRGEWGKFKEKKQQKKEFRQNFRNQKKDFHKKDHSQRQPSDSVPTYNYLNQTPPHTEIPVNQYSKILNPKIPNTETIQHSNISLALNYSSEAVPKRNGLRTAQEIVTQITPIYYILIIFATFLALLNKRITPLFFSASIVLQVIVFSYDIFHVFPKFHQRSIPYAGIPLIIIGGSSLIALGFGVPLIARGILYLLEFIKNTKSHEPNHPIVSEGSFSSLLWIREVTLSFIYVLNPLVLVLYVNGILLNIDGYINSSGNSTEIAKFVVTLSLTFVAIILFYLFAYPNIKDKAIGEISERIYIFLIILGFVGITSSFGFLLVVTGILIIVYQKNAENHKRIIPVSTSVQPSQYNLVVTQSSPYNNLDRDKLGNLKRNFNPETGKPISNRVILKSNSIKIENSNENRIDNSKSSPSKTNINLSGDTTKEIFTILTPKIRKILIELPITIEDRELLSKSLIYMDEEHQLKYMQEIEEINQDPSKIYQLFIKRIKKLPIEDSEKRFLVEQLDYLPAQKQEEFVSFLEQNVN